MNFFQQLKHSLYRRDFYHSLSGRPFSFSFKYYLKLISLLALIAAILFSLIALPRLTSLLFNLEKAVTSVFPEELEITIVGGQVSTNVEEPYAIALPDEISAEALPADLVNLLVIDTAGGDIIEKFDQAKTLALITGDSFVYRDNAAAHPAGESIVANKIPSDTNLVINKSSLLTFLNRFDGVLVFIPPFLVIGVFAAVFISLLLPLIYILLVAFIVWVLYKIFGSAREKELGYKTMYQVSLHASTLGFLGAVLVIFFRPALNPIFIFTILTFLAIFANMQKAGKRGNVV